MPRNDQQEERDYAENNKQVEQENIKIVSDSELINLKLDNVLKNQSILANNLQNIIELLSSEQSVQTDSN